MTGATLILLAAGVQYGRRRRAPILDGRGPAEGLIVVGAAFVVTALVLLSYSADTNWPTLHRWGSTTGSFSFDLTLSAHDGPGSATCTAHSLLDYELTGDLSGVASCRNLRADAADKLIETIRAEADALTGR